MTSFITQLPSAFTDTSLLKLVRDPAIALGTRLLFDFKNGYCNPNPIGNLADAATFVNLVDGAPGATLIAGAQKLINDAATTGGIRAPGVDASGQAISLGITYNLYPTNHSFIALAWVKCPSVALNKAYQTIFSYGVTGSSQSGLFFIDSGADGKSPRVVANNQANVPVYNSVPGFTVDVVHQVGVAWRPGFFDVILDGVVVASFANVNVSLLDMSTSNMSALSNRQSATLYRLLLEDLIVSGRSASQAAAADFSAATGRFS